VIKRVKNYIPFLINYRLWPHLRRIFFRKICKEAIGYVDTNRVKDVSRFEAELWCERVSIEPKDALEKLGITDQSKEFSEKYSEELKEAQSNALSCPYKLGGPTNMSMLFQIVDGIEAKRVIETGVAYGWSSLSILLSLSNREGAKLWSIDLPYVAFNNSKWVGVVVPAKLKGMWKLIRNADREGLPQALKQAGRVDLAHYDSDKSIEGRMFAYPLIWEKLRPGGILISDDVNDNLAFAQFCHEKNIQPIVVKDKGKYQGIAVKD